MPAAHGLVTRLEVHTPYQELLDEIVISALIVERKRLTPGRDGPLFNLT